jgi:hypothetical protein
MAEPLYEPIPFHQLDEGMADLEVEPWKEKYYQDPRFDFDREEISAWEGGELEFLEAFQDAWADNPDIPPRGLRPGETPPSEEMHGEVWGRIVDLRERQASEINERLARLAMRDRQGPIRLASEEQLQDWRHRPDPLDPLASPNISKPSKMRWSFAGEEQWREAMPGGVPSTPGSVMDEREMQRKAMAQDLAGRQRILGEQAERKRAQDDEMRTSAQQLIRQHVPYAGGFFGGR